MSTGWKDAGHASRPVRPLADDLRCGCGHIFYSELSRTAQSGETLGFKDLNNLLGAFFCPAEFTTSFWNVTAFMAFIRAQPALYHPTVGAGHGQSFITV